MFQIGKLVSLKIINVIPLTAKQQVWMKAVTQRIAVDTPRIFDCNSLEFRASRRILQSFENINKEMKEISNQKAT